MLSRHVREYLRARDVFFGCFRLKECINRYTGFGFALDVNFPPGQFRGESSVLSLPPNGEREFIVWHNDARASVSIAHLHPRYLGWTQRVADKNPRVIAPFNQIDFLVIQFSDDCLDANAFDPDAGADSVYRFISCGDSNF